MAAGGKYVYEAILAMIDELLKMVESPLGGGGGHNIYICFAGAK